MFQKAFAIVPLGSLAAVQAAYAVLSETGDPGPVFEGCTLNSTGSADDPVTHYAACFHIGPEGAAAIASLSLSILGSAFLGPAADVPLSQIEPWLADAGLYIRRATFAE